MRQRSWGRTCNPRNAALSLGLDEIKERDPRTYELLTVGLNAMPLTDKKTFELLAARRRPRRVPARIGRHPRTAQAHEARQHPRPDRHQRPLSPRPALRRHGRCLCQSQAWPREADLRPSAHGGGAEGNLRRPRLSRTVHAHPEPARRHRAGQRLCLHQGDLEEEGRDHQRPPGRLHQGRPGTRRQRGRWRKKSSA